MKLTKVNTKKNFIYKYDSLTEMNEHLVAMTMAKFIIESVDYIGLTASISQIIK